MWLGLCGYQKWVRILCQSIGADLRWPRQILLLKIPRNELNFWLACEVLLTKKFRCALAGKLN